MFGLAMVTQTDEVLVETRGRLGLLTLNRPKALNALSLAMVAALDEALLAFERDPAIDAILLRGAGDRAFCAGGDVRALVTAPPEEGERLRRGFFAGEYALNYHLHTCPKPVVALLNGITMGGGCGLSLHASHRVSTERTLLAMPETVLGLFPDVGATWFLNQLAGEMGLYLGLTGARIRANDLCALGMATHHAAASVMPTLIEALAAEERLDAAAIDAVLARFAADPGAPAVAAHRPRIDALFSGATIPKIVAALENAPEDWAAEALGVIRRASPTSLEVTLRQLRGGSMLSIEDVFRTEYRLAVRLTGSNDFREGVRAILIDKHGAPRWNPSRIEDVDPSAIEALFAPLGPDEPELSLARVAP
ncbi:MAG: enoyl-CoA hydratase/isomerase family protein [Aliidongia sp.]